MTITIVTMLMLLEAADVTVMLILDDNLLLNNFTFIFVVYIIFKIINLHLVDCREEVVKIFKEKIIILIFFHCLILNCKCYFNKFEMSKQ